MDDFDRLLELELARMLDDVVKAPAPSRGWPPGRPRPVVKLFTGLGSSIGPTATVVVLADGPGGQQSEVAFPHPAIFS
jgi:hypothetical protein